MFYYFDESGNWEEMEKENNILVIGGIVVRNEELKRETEQEIKKFLAEYNLDHLHITKLPEQQREKIFEIILKFLEQGAFQGLFYRMIPSVFNSQTNKDATDIYIDTASEVISIIALGDDNIKIEYDMKFHYAYPSLIIERVESKKYRSDDVFEQMKRNFYLKEDSIKFQKRRLSKIYKNNSSLLRRLENINFFYNYLWEEFRAKVESSAIAKTKLRERILSKLEQKQKELGLNTNFKLEIKFMNKWQQSPLIGVVDALNNIIYNEKKDNTLFEIPITKEILKKLTIKEIKDEI